MNSEASSHAPVEDLLAHAEWLRHLATRLLGESEAEDAVQDTLAAALKAPPQAAQSRPWLAEVLRNFARRRWRRGRIHTRAVGALGYLDEGSAPAPDELLVRTALQRELVDLVLQLEEPYRRTLLLRYYEGKSAVAIAAEMGVPAGTVRWRLSTGIARLRGRLDETHGRERWRALLLPLAFPRGTKPVTAAAAGAAGVVGALLLRGAARKWMAAVAVTALVAAGTTAVVRQRGRDGRGFDVAAARRLSPHVVVDPGAGNRALTRTGSVVGQVVRPDGRPVPGALVVMASSDASRAPDTLPPTASTDQNGAFGFEGAALGDHRLTASAPGWSAALSPTIKLQAGAQVSVTLRLQEGGATLSGHVLDDGGGPVPGARITARLGYPFGTESPELPEHTYATTADDQGRYQLTLRPREYQLMVSAGGYASKTTAVAVTRDVTRDLRLQPAARLFGTVVDRASGQPVAGATVRLASLEMPQGHRQKLTDEEGRFGFDDVDDGSFQIIAIDEARNLVGIGPTVAAVPTVNQAGLQVALDPGQTLVGRVVDATGAAVAGARVTAMWGGRQVLSSVSADSGADGAFRLQGLLPGRHWVRAQHPRLGQAGEEATIVAGRPLTLTVRLGATPANEFAASGVVLDAGGRPISGALVRTERASMRGYADRGAETDDQGHFRIADVPGDTATLVAWHPTVGVGRAPLRRTGERIEPTELRLSPGASIVGHVHYEDGAPAAGVSVAATRQSYPVFYDSDTTAPDGSFAIRNLAEGNYNVQATRKRGPNNLYGGRRDPSLLEVTTAAGEQHTVKLVLPRGGKRIVGQVLRSDGEPAPGVRVAAGEEVEGQAWKPFGHILDHVTTSGEDGRFVLEDVEDRSYTLYASLPGSPDGELPGVKAGRKDVRLRLPASASLAGRAVTADGRPVPDYALSVLPALGPQPTPDDEDRRRVAAQLPPLHVHDASGAFEQKGLRAGRYELRVVLANGGGTLEVMLTEGESRRDLRVLVNTEGQLRGRLVMADGSTPARGVSVSVEDSGHDLFGDIDRSGNFTVKGLMPGGRVRVSIRDAAERFVHEDREVSVPGTGVPLDLGTIRLLEGDFEKALETRGRFGIRPTAQGGRVTIGEIAPGSPAAAAGLHPGDELLAIAGQSLENLGDNALLFLLVRPPGETNTLTVRPPGGEPRTVKLTAAPLK
jgi:RNA polymerase sigma factor (sigma-70 family)